MKNSDNFLDYAHHSLLLKTEKVQNLYYTDLDTDAQRRSAASAAGPNREKVRLDNLYIYDDYSLTQFLLFSALVTSTLLIQLS